MSPNLSASSRCTNLRARGWSPTAAGSLGLAWLMGAAAVAGATPPQYTVRFLTPGLDAINASAMNQAGEVFGTTNMARGWVSRAGAPAVLLPLPAGALYSAANDINDAGVIVGSVSAPGLAAATAWIPDDAGGYTIQPLGTLPGNPSSGATALNNVGDIVGSVHNGTFSRPVLFTAPGGVQDLTPTGIFDPRAINDQRVLVDATFKRLDLDTLIVEDLGLPGPSYIGATGEAINASGQVAGSVILATSTTCDHQAARYTDGVGWEVFSICGPANSVWDMNDLGDVVMRLNVAPYVRFQEIGTFLIEELIVADDGHWTVINGFGLTIDNARQLAVPATNSVTGEGGIVLLTPGQPCLADFDADGAVNSDDFFAFLDAYFAGTADFDGDGTVDSNDFFAFLTAYFEGC